MLSRHRYVRSQLAVVVSLVSMVSCACDGSEGPGPAVLPPIKELTTEALTLTDPPTDVTAMEFLPGRTDLFVGTRAGTIHHLRLDPDDPSAVTRIGTFEVPLVHLELDCGLISLAFAPDFETHPALYVGQCTSKTESAIRRLPLDPVTFTPVAGADVDVFRAGDPSAPRPWHNIGSIGFEPDGTLWALFGDKAVRANGQALDNPLGSLVRLRPNAEGAGATPAPDNPFVGDATKSPYIYASGLRSPWRGTRDANGRWFIGDVGEDKWEEVNAVTYAGQNFGWGNHEGPCEVGCQTLPDYADPTVAWDRSDASPFVLEDPLAEPSPGRVVWVGPSYDEATEDRYGGLLNDRILYGDLCVGFMRGLVLGEDGALVDDRAVGHLHGATAMALGPDGYLYAATFGKCSTASAPMPTTLLRLVPAPSEAEPNP